MVKPVWLFSLFHLLCLISLNISAKNIVVYNDTDQMVQVVIIPKAVPLSSKKKVKKILKNRVATIKPGKSKKLKRNEIDSIDVKVFKDAKKGMNWFKYDNLNAHGLLQQIKQSEDKVILRISASGSSYKAFVGRHKITGDVQRFSKIWRSSKFDK